MKPKLMGRSPRKCINSLCLVACPQTDVLYYGVFSKSAEGGAEVRIAVVGPTAVGKTAVGVALAERLNAEIVNADSMQVYRRMDIGTAKPTAFERSRAVFHAIDVADPDTDWTLADFQAVGNEAIASIDARERVALIVGGSGLYVRALTTRLDIPAVAPDEALRARWQEYATEHGNLALQAEVARVDPESAARIHVNDIKRLIRALEVHTILGRSLSDLHRENRAEAPKDNVLIFGLNFEDRRALYARIEARVDTMIADGFVDEVARLLRDGYTRKLKPMQSLGYRQLAEYLAGETDLPAAIDSVKRDTRHFARRQMIWFRGDSRVQWIDVSGKSPAELADEIGVQLNEQLTSLKKGYIARS